MVSQSEVFITQFIPPILQAGFCAPGSGTTPDVSPPSRTSQAGNCPTTSPDGGVSRYSRGHGNRGACPTGPSDGSKVPGSTKCIPTELPTPRRARGTRHNDLLATLELDATRTEHQSASAGPARDPPELREPGPTATGIWACGSDAKVPDEERQGHPAFETPAPTQRCRGMKTAASRFNPTRGGKTPGPDPDGASCSESDRCEEGWKSLSYAWKGPRLSGRDTCTGSTTSESNPEPRPGVRARSCCRTMEFPMTPGEQPGGSRDRRHPPGALSARRVDPRGGSRLRS